MKCYVYKGDKKEDHFLYLSSQLEQAKAADRVPDALLEMLGELALVLDFDLTESRRLPNADAKQILSALSEQGFYYQMPKDSMHADEEQYFN